MDFHCTAFPVPTTVAGSTVSGTAFTGAAISTASASLSGTSVSGAAFPISVAGAAISTTVSPASAADIGSHRLHPRIPRRLYETGQQHH